MYYALVTIAGLIMSVALGMLSTSRYGKVVTTGVTAIFVGVLLVVFGRFYIASTDNPFTITDTDLMTAGLTVGIIGAFVAFYLSRFVALESRPKQPHVGREDVGYWPRSY